MEQQHYNEKIDAVFLNIFQGYGVFCFSKSYNIVNVLKYGKCPYFLITRTKNMSVQFEKQNQIVVVTETSRRCRLS